MQRILSKAINSRGGSFDIGQQTQGQTGSSLNAGVATGDDQNPYSFNNNSYTMAMSSHKNLKNVKYRNPDLVPLMSTLQGPSSGLGSQRDQGKIQMQQKSPDYQNNYGMGGYSNAGKISLQSIFPMMQQQPRGQQTARDTEGLMSL